MSRAVLGARVVLLVGALGLSCTPPMRGMGPRTGGRTHFHQSCGPACAAPVNASTGEFLAPAAVRTGPALVGRAVEAIEAAQGLLTVQRLLTEAELAEVETVLTQCVAQAHADVNEAYQRGVGGQPFKNKKFPSDAECDLEVGVDDDGNAVTLAQELGRLKHAAAFACIKARLPQPFHNSFSIEPRYKGEPKLNGTVLTNNKRDSLRPDVVVHATRNATDIQCVYEFKFPCHERHRLVPMRSPLVEAQLDSYSALSKGCRVTLVTPSGPEPYRGR